MIHGRHDLESLFETFRETLEWLEHYLGRVK
jgi:hypothetical protein